SPRSLAIGESGRRANPKSPISQFPNPITRLPDHPITRLSGPPSEWPVPQSKIAPMAIRARSLAVAVLSLVAAPLAAQNPSAGSGPPAAGAAQDLAAMPSVTVCGTQTAPRAQPRAGTGPVVLFIAPCFEAQGNASVIEPQTYLYYIQLKQSRPSEGVWLPYDETSEKMIIDDFHRLWNTNFLDNLWIDTSDYKFPNGTIGKIVTYNMEERQRVKIVDYVGSKKIEVSKIDEKLKEDNSVIRLDSFIDPGLVRKVEGTVRDMLREKGFQFASVTHEIKQIEGGPKLVHITFKMDEGPKVKIRKIDLVGNKAISDGQIKRQLKATKERAGFQDFDHFPTWFLTLIGDHGTYQETKFDEDAEKVVAYYR